MVKAFTCMFANGVRCRLLQLRLIAFKLSLFVYCTITSSFHNDSDIWIKYSPFLWVRNVEEYYWFLKKNIKINKQTVYISSHTTILLEWTVFATIRFADYVWATRVPSIFLTRWIRLLAVLKKLCFVQGYWYEEHTEKRLLLLYFTNSLVDKKHRQSTENDMQMLCTTAECSLSIQSTSH